MTYPVIYEPDEIAARLCILEDDEVEVGGTVGVPIQEWTPYDDLGRQYIVDLPNGQAFLVTVEPYASLEGVES